MRKGLLLLVGLQAALAGPAAADPVGRWALNEGAGQVAADSSGRGYDGRLGETGAPDQHDPSWVPGRFGSALRFDADWDLFVSIGNPPALLPPRVTVEAWVRRLGSPGTWRYVFSSGATACHAAPYGLYTGFTGGLAFYVSGVGGYVLSPEAEIGAVWDGGWHHAAGTYDGQRVRLYIDGIEVASGTPTTLAIRYGLGSRGVLIGTYRGSCSRPFTGDIDEVAVHDHALSAAQVAAASRGTGAPLPPQVPPVAGPPASGTAGPGAGQPGPARCLTVAVKPRRIVAYRRTRVLVTVRRGRKPAAGRRVAVRGAGLRRTVRTGRKGRAGFTVRASRAGRLRLKALDHSRRCPVKFVRVTGDR